MGLLKRTRRQGERKREKGSVLSTSLEDLKFEPSLNFSVNFCLPFVVAVVVEIILNLVSAIS